MVHPANTVITDIGDSVSPFCKTHIRFIFLTFSQLSPQLLS